MRRLLSAVCVLGVVVTLAGPGVPAEGRGEAPADRPAAGLAHDPGPLADAALDIPAPPVPPGSRPPLADGPAAPAPASTSTETSTSASASTETVIGPDRRTRVAATTEYPSSAIGFLTFTQSGGNYLCSGFLIDPNTVLTAGHCVHEGGPFGNYSQNVVFTPGRNGANAPFGTCRATAVEAAAGWLGSAAEEEDYGWIQLDCLIGHLVGWFGYTATGDVTGTNAAVRGYPADKAPATMWTADGTVDLVQGGQAFYLMDTFGGQSGSPVYEADRAECGGPCALAVHAYGLHGAPPHSTHNHGSRIDETRAAALALVAAANDRIDDEGPTIAIRTPSDGAVFAAGQAPRADYGCDDAPTGSGIRSCTGPVEAGQRFDVTPGTHRFTVRAEDGAGNVTTLTHTYRVEAAPPEPPVTVGPVAARPSFAG